MPPTAPFKVQRIPYPETRSPSLGELNEGKTSLVKIPRVETGAVQFGNDWPGLFIRGDDAFDLAMQIKHIGDFLHSIPDKVKVEEGGAELALAYMRLRSLREMILEDVVIGPAKELRNEDGPGATS
jgi:hypothetical protein